MNEMEWNGFTRESDWDELDSTLDLRVCYVLNRG